MAYTGEVEVGGPPQTRTLDALTISKVAVGEMSNNAYLLECRSTGDQLLIDAAAEPETLTEFVSPAHLRTVLTTHRHADHWQALGELVEFTAADTIAGEPDADAIPVATNHRVWTDDTVRFGEIELRVIGLVGHTPGSIALLYDDPSGHPHLWTGDSLFPGGVGKTWSEEDFASLLDEVETKIFDALPDDTWFYPGHGDDSTLGAERPGLPEWRERGW